MIFYITVVNLFSQKCITKRAKIKRLETENDILKSQIESLNKKMELFKKMDGI